MNQYTPLTDKGLLLSAKIWTFGISRKAAAEKVKTTHTIKSEFFPYSQSMCIAPKLPGQLASLLHASWPIKNQETTSNNHKESYDRSKKIRAGPSNSTHQMKLLQLSRHHTNTHNQKYRQGFAAVGDGFQSQEEKIATEKVNTTNTSSSELSHLRTNPFALHHKPLVNPSQLALLLHASWTIKDQDTTSKPKRESFSRSKQNRAKLRNKVASSQSRHWEGIQREDQKTGLTGSKTWRRWPKAALARSSSQTPSCPLPRSPGSAGKAAPQIQQPTNQTSWMPYLGYRRGDKSECRSELLRYRSEYVGRRLDRNGEERSQATLLVRLLLALWECDVVRIPRVVWASVAVRWPRACVAFGIDEVSRNWACVRQ